MFEKISILGMEHQRWLQLRKTGIGGSDVGAICGLNPYSSPMKVYQEKMPDFMDMEDSESMRVGRDLEEYVAQRFMEETGLKVRRSNYMYRSKTYPFMIADVDRLVVGEDAGLECKTANAYNADKWKDGAVPIHYYLQCQHYMSVTGRKFWYIAVLIMGIGFQYRKLERDEELIKNMILIEKDFWEGHVVPQILPEPDGSKVCDEIITQYFGKSGKGTEVFLSGFDEQLRRRNEIDLLLHRLEQERNQIDQTIKLYMGENETAYNDSYRVSWINVETSRIDTKRLKEERPDIYDEYLKASISRRFSIKAA